MKKIIISLDFIYDFKILYSEYGLYQSNFITKTNHYTELENIPPWLKKAIKQIQNLFKTGRADFSNIPIDNTGVTEFRKKVYAELQKTQSGLTLSYQDLGKKIQSPKAARAIGSAMSCNRLPLIIPCHRVVKASGKLGNYSAIGGVKTKAMIIDLERRSI